MADADVRHSISGTGSGSTITITASGLTVQAGDPVVLHLFGYTSLGSPSGSDVTWAEELSDTQSGPFGNTDIHKVLVGVAPDSSLSDFTVANGAPDQWGYVLTSVMNGDSTTPVDTSGAGEAKAANSSTFGGAGIDPPAPSISPDGSNSLLLSAVGHWPGGSASRSFTPPSGMTELADLGGWDRYSVAYQKLTSSGATGTKAFVESPSETGGSAWITSSIAIKSASGGGATDLVVADASHAQAADGVTLTQGHALTVADAGHGHTVENVTLTQVHQLLVQDASHAHTADPVGLSDVEDWVDEFDTYGTGEQALGAPWTTHGGGAFKTYSDGAGYDVLYEAGSSGNPTAATRPTPTLDFEVEGVLKLSGSPETSDRAVHGMAARVTDMDNLVAFEAVKHDGVLPGAPTPENKHALYVRVGGVERMLDTSAASYAYDTEYTFLLRVVGDEVTAFLDGVEVAAGTLTSAENDALTAQTAGVINYAGFPFWDRVSATTVVPASDLVVQDATHDQTADGPALTQVHLLAVQDATHAHAADGVALTQVHALVVDDAAHGHEVESPTLTQVHVLEVADALHGHTAEQVTLTSGSTLAVDSATHGHTAGGVVLTQAHSLVVQDSVLAHAAELVALTQVHALVVLGALHAHTVDQVALVLGEIVTPADRTIAIEAESRVVTVPAESRTITC